jgi:macrolide transport system ATP-binding/permease protein
MRWADIVRLRLRSLLGRTKVEQELDEELRYHLERQIEENLSAGMNSREAREEALRSFEGWDQRKEECRDMRGWNLVDNTLQDLRFAMRQLRKTPGTERLNEVYARRTAKVDPVLNRAQLRSLEKDLSTRQT